MSQNHLPFSTHSAGREMLNSKAICTNKGGTPDSGSYLVSQNSLLVPCCKYSIKTECKPGIIEMLESKLLTLLALPSLSSDTCPSDGNDAGDHYQGVQNRDDGFGGEWHTQSVKGLMS